MMTLRRGLLRPLALVYAAALRLQHRLRSAGRLPVRRLPEAVISVGSLSAGGAGKTPMVLALAEALGRREYAVRILTRGYGRRGTGVERVESTGDAMRFGDEPLLLARRCGVPVFVGADRYRAGLLAGALPAAGHVVNLLDDGFQHRQLARDVDVVLLTAKDVNDALLPAGNLREPLARLREADILVLREEERESLERVVREILDEDKTSSEARQPVLWTIQRRLVFSPEGSAALLQRPVAFCGIARPESFGTMLEVNEVRPVRMEVFADHHRYTERDAERLVRRARTLRADGFVTTEKDAIKLTDAMRRRLAEIGPLVVPALVVEIVDEKRVMDALIGTVQGMNRRRRSARQMDGAGERAAWT